jgi:hypothetical protein
MTTKHESTVETITEALSELETDLGSLRDTLLVGDRASLSDIAEAVDAVEATLCKWFGEVRYRNTSWASERLHQIIAELDGSQTDD